MACGSDSSPTTQERPRLLDDRIDRHGWVTGHVLTVIVKPGEMVAVPVSSGLHRGVVQIPDREGAHSRCPDSATADMRLFSGDIARQSSRTFRQEAHTLIISDDADAWERYYQTNRVLVTNAEYLVVDTMRDDWTCLQFVWPGPERSMVPGFVCVDSCEPWEWGVLFKHQTLSRRRYLRGAAHD